MADYRTVKVAMWAQDEWFMDLPIDGKLLWLYLFTNGHTSVCGLYKLPLRTILFETGLSKDRALELLDSFAASKKAKYADGVVWVMKMREHQGTSSPLVAKRIQTDLDIIPDTPLKREYLSKYSIDTVSIGYLESRADTDTDTDKETETDWSIPSTHRDIMQEQYTKILGMIPTASYPEMIGYMDKLQELKVGAWWVLALTETVDHAKRPSWQYMKSILESWLAAGVPSTSKNGTDPAKKATTGLYRNPSPDGLQWIYYDTTTGKEVKREPRDDEEATF